MSIDWWRSWHGAPTDNKWLAVARDSQCAPAYIVAIVWALFDHASQQENRGDVSRFDVAGTAAFIGCDESQALVIIEELTKRKVIVNGRLSQWEKRQPKREDNSTERTRNYRERTVTQCDARERLDRDRDRDKESKKERGATAPPRPRSKRGFQLPEDWSPSENHFFEGERLGFSAREVGSMAEDMRLWAGAKGETKKNWNMAFSGWMRRETKRAPPKLSRTQQAFRQLSEEIASGKFDSGNGKIDSGAVVVQLPKPSSRSGNICQAVDYSTPESQAGRFESSGQSAFGTCGKREFSDDSGG